MTEMSGELLLVKKIYGELVEQTIWFKNSPIPVVEARIKCLLENDELFQLDNVHPEVVFMLKKIDGEEIDDDRESIVDVIFSLEIVKNIMRHYLKRVIIDKFDHETRLYSAIAEFGNSSIEIRRTMIPSHAILLARLLEKPIYVRRELVMMQNRFYRGRK
ncbi:MAG: hypothetical protein QXT88_02060 [Desulfurococcaceae archaeon]